jgi:tetratricopeptide (TPR) repeat protein
MSRSRPRTRFHAYLAAIVAAILLLALVPAHAESVLSDRVSDQLMQLYRLDITRRLKSEFEQRKQSLGTQETVERAAKLRMLIKERAAMFEQFDDIEHAAADYDALTEIKPPDPAVYLDRGYFFMRQGRYGDAKRVFMTGARLAPDQAVFSYAAGRALTRMGEYADAIAQYGEAIRLAPNDGVAPLSRAEVYLKLDQGAPARADFDRALALGLARGDDRFFAYFGRGYARILLGDFAGAVGDLDAALAVRPGMVNAVVWRGYALERMGRRDRALDAYEAALRISPKDAWLRTSISRMRS